MIGWSSTLRSLAVVTTGAFVSFLAVSLLTLPGADINRARSVRGCHSAHHATKPVPTIPQPLQVDVAQFGLQDINAEGDFVFDVTDEVPLIAGTSFGWRMHLDGITYDALASEDGIEDPRHGRQVRLTEVFVLPRAPAHWGIGPSTVLSDDLTTATTTDVVSLNRVRDGWLSSSWSVSAGDPPGDYKMLVYLDGQLVKTFEFTVRAPRD